MKLVDGLTGLIADLRQNCAPLVQDVLKNTLEKMNLVTREEFDAQTKVLAKAQDTLTELQTRLEAMKNKQD